MSIQAQGSGNAAWQDEFCGDPFLLWQTVAETMANLPPDLKAIVVQNMAGSERPDVREAAVIGLLDPDPDVRLEAVASLAEALETIGAPGLNRIDILTPWLPAEEQETVKQLGDAVRASGVIPPPNWAAAMVELYASPMDSTGTASLFALVPDGRRCRLASVLVRRGAGIVDAVLSETMGPARAKRLISEAGRQALIAPVSLEYGRRWMGDLLAAHQQADTVPPQGLLQVAEAVGVRDWVPVAVNWQRQTEDMVAALPARMTDPASVAQVVAASAVWAKRSGLTDSWMEEDEEAREIVLTNWDPSGRRLAGVAMAEVLEPRRERWAEQCVRSADWLREAYGDSAPWAEFVLLAREIYNGRSLYEIPLMQAVAARTALAAEWASGPAEFPVAPPDSLME